MEKRVRQRVTRQKTKSMRAGVIIEASLWIAFLAMAVPAIADIFFLSNTRLALGQITREAVMTQITYPASIFNNVSDGIESQISTDRSIQEQELGNCVRATGSGNGTNSPDYVLGFNEKCAHDFVKWRIIRLIESNKIRVKTDDIIVMTKIVNRSMEVKVTTTYDSLFAIFKNKKINTEAAAHYLGA